MTHANYPGWFDCSCFDAADLSEAQETRLAALVVEEQTRILADSQLALTPEQKATLTERFASVKDRSNRVS